MNRKKLQMSLIFAILFIAYTVTLFLLKTEFNTMFFVSFAFVLFAFLFVMVSFFFVSNEKRKSQVVGMPVTVLSVIYFVLEFILGTVFMALKTEVSFAGYFVPQFLLGMLFLLCFVSAILSPNNYKKEEQKKENIEENKEEIKEENK